MHRVNLNQERFNQQVIDNASFGIALVGSEGVILTVNPAMERIFGYSKAELDGMKLQELFNPDDEFGNIHDLRELMGDRTDIQLETRFLSKKGDQMWGMLTLKFFSGEDHPSYYICQIVDITKQKESEQRLQESVERYTSLKNTTMTPSFPLAWTAGLLTPTVWLKK